MIREKVFVPEQRCIISFIGSAKFCSMLVSSSHLEISVFVKIYLQRAPVLRKEDSEYYVTKKTKIL